MKDSRLKHAGLPGQAILEYLLIMVAVSLLVFGAFKAGSGGGVIDQTRQTTNQYFDSGVKAIMGGYYNPATHMYQDINPEPIDGGWCSSGHVNGKSVRECACPRPAFGGKPCVGEAIRG